MDPKIFWNHEVSHFTLHPIYKKPHTYSLIISAGKSSGTSSKPTSRQDSANSSTAPEHWHPLGSQTEQICLAVAPYDPYSLSSLSYNSLASFSESMDEANTTDSRMPDDVIDGGRLVTDANVDVVGWGAGGGSGCNVETNGTVDADDPTAPARIRCTMHNTNRTTISPDNIPGGARFAIPRICSFARHLAEHKIAHSRI